MAENNTNNGAVTPEETKKGFFGKVKDAMSDFSEKHPKVAKAAKVGCKIGGGVALVFAGAFAGGVFTGIKAERKRSESEETEEETVDLPETEEAPAEEAEAEEAPEEAPVEEQAEE